VKKGSAHIRSPEVVKRFRHCFVKFEEASRQALDSMANDLHSVTDWLKGDQLRYWRRQHRIRHDEMKQAWREYVDARHGDRRMGKPSSVDERKAWERAKRRVAEAEQKIERVKGWAGALEREAQRLSPPMVRFDEMISSLVPKALARLDHMLENLEEYLRKTPPKEE
jgi:hypothetical protein